jgi:phage-related protein
MPTVYPVGYDVKTKTSAFLPMNLEQTVLENLRLLPSTKQQDVLVFIQSLISPTEKTEHRLKQHTVEKVLPALAEIQRFYDGLPSAVYAYGLFEATAGMDDRFPNDPLTPFLTALYSLLTTENQWIKYTAEFYQAVSLLLCDLTEQIFLSDSVVQEAIQTLNQLSTTMIQSGIVTDSESDEVDNPPGYFLVEHTDNTFDYLCPPIDQAHQKYLSETMVLGN